MRPAQLALDVEYRHLNPVRNTIYRHTTVPHGDLEDGTLDIQLTDDTGLGFFYAHERGARIYDGPDEVHKSVVSRSLVKARARELGHDV